jgi:hypothetical protein
MCDEVFKTRLNLKFIEIDVESDFRKMKDNKLNLFIRPAVIFSFISSVAVSTFISFYIESSKNIKIFQFSLFTSWIASFIYFIFIVGLCITKNLKLYRWMNFFFFYFQIYVIIAIRFALVKIVKVSSIMIFFEYFLEIFIRLFWVILYLQSFSESLIMNMLSLVTVWIVICSMYPVEYLREEIIITLAYSFVIFSVIVLAWIIERQQKLAFYFKWKAEKKASWLTKVLDNLNSGFISMKKGKINYINSFLLSLIYKFKQLKNKNTNNLLHKDLESKNIFLKSCMLNF